ncbi:MAG: aminotransferase class IV [Bacteroidota bacterium]
MDYLNHNGFIRPLINPLFGPDNRVFRYGDGLFESIRIKDGKACFLERHLRRLKKGMHLLGYDIPLHYNAEFMQREIDRMTGGKGHHRLRLTVYRQDGGYYAPQSDESVYLMQLHPLEQADFRLHDQGLSLGVYDEIPLPMHPLSNLKSCNSLPYVLAGRFLKKQNFDECLLLNQDGRVAECSIGNVFMIKEQQLITPPLSEGCIEGVIRGLILEIAEQTELEVWQRAISLEELTSATEIGVTNAIRGIRWVERWDARRYQNQYCRRLLAQLNELSLYN